MDFQVIVMPILLSIVLGNFKNVKLIPERFARAKQRRNLSHKSKKETVYLIQVIEYKDEYYPIHCLFEKTNGQSTTAFHTVRLHQRYYPPERPLFGKYTGWVLIPPHTRGNKKNGETIKDYKLVT